MDDTTHTRVILVGGAGGTGKSTVAQALTQLTYDRSMEARLVQ